MADSRRLFVRKMYFTASSLLFGLGAVLIAMLWLMNGRGHGAPGFWAGALGAFGVYLVFSGLVVVFIVSWSLRSILRPLGNTMVVASRVAQGDLTVALTSLGSREADGLTQAIGTMLKALRGLAGLKEIQSFSGAGGAFSPEGRSALPTSSVTRFTA